MFHPSSLKSDTPPLTLVQRRQLRDLLDARWRDCVVELTDIAVEFHALDDDVPSTHRLVVARRLATVRRRLLEIEEAMRRVHSRTYGRCDGCERRLPFEQLELVPEARYCHTCAPPGRHAP